MHLHLFQFATFVEIKWKSKNKICCNWPSQCLNILVPKCQCLEGRRINVNACMSTPWRSVPKCHVPSNHPLLPTTLYNYEPSFAVEIIASTVCWFFYGYVLVINCRNTMKKVLRSSKFLTKVFYVSMVENRTYSEFDSLQITMQVFQIISFTVVFPRQNSITIVSCESPVAK